MATTGSDLGLLDMKGVEVTASAATNVVAAALPAAMASNGSPASISAPGLSMVSAPEAIASSHTAAAIANYHRRTWSARHGGLLMLLEVGAMFAATLLLSPAIAWLCVTALFVCFLITAGKMTGGRYSTALIDERNLMSLSRAQAVFWTILVLSAYFVLVMVRVRNRIADPLNIAIDKDLWALMGISVASLVGTPMLLADKRGKEPADQAIDKAAAALRVPCEQIDQNRQGTLFVNPHPLDARFSDMFEGEEVGNTAYLQLSKFQMFVFTMVAGAAFSSELWTILRLGEISKMDHLPLLPVGLVTLLGISHAGYLTNSGVDHTPPPRI